MESTNRKVESGEELTGAMWVCQSCLNKIMASEDKKYYECDDYVDGTVCECCGKKTKHLTEIATAEEIEKY